MLPASIFLAISCAAQACSAAECDDVPLLQTQRKLDLDLDKTMKAECEEAVPWPCHNEQVSSFALQVINAQNCAGPDGATIYKLNEAEGSAGNYTPLCHVPNNCLNACAIDPVTKFVWCAIRHFNENLVRVDCRVDATELEERLLSGTIEDYTPVTGTVCFFGRLPTTFAANFDDEGNFWFQRTIFNANRPGFMYRLLSTTLSNLNGQGQTTPIGTFVPESQTVVVQRDVDFGRLADLSLLTRDLGNGDQKYVVGCYSNKVLFQQVSGDLTGVNPIILTMDGETPGQGEEDGAGAQWLFKDQKLYCAYNDGTGGVIEVKLNDINLVDLTVGVVRVSPSAATINNDGLNCLAATSPFRSTDTIQAGEQGDPHIQTLDGDHYLLLNQGSFSFWNFSGVDAENSRSKKVPVKMQIFTHYSGHSSYTKGLLLVDSTGGAGRSLEMTSEDCRWRTKTNTSWHPVTGPALLTLPDSDGDELTAFNMTTSAGQQIHVELLMKTVGGFHKIGNLYAACKPRHHINVKISMFSRQDVLLVKGQLGHHASENIPVWNPATNLLEADTSRMDNDFLSSRSWGELGGSMAASAYLKQVDDEGAASFVKSCAPEEKEVAKSTCAKVLGSPAAHAAQKDRAQFLANIFDDCVFDVCAGGGDVAAQLAAAYMNGF